MKKISKSDNSKLFQEAEDLRKSIQVELHGKARNTKSNDDYLQSSSDSSPSKHNKSSKRTP